MQLSSKLLLIGGAATVLVFAQPARRFNYAMYRATQGFRIEAFDRRVMVTFSTYAGDCRGSVRPGPAGAVSDAPPGILWLQGDVEVTTGDSVLQANEAYYHCNTGEIEPLGNVHFRFAPQE